MAVPEKGKLPRLTDAQRKQRERALKAGKPDPFTDEVRAALFAKQEEEQAAEVELSLLRLQCQEFDATGERYKSEVRRKEQLLNLWLGLPESGEDLEEVLEVKKKKTDRPNPSKTKVQIPDSSIDPIEVKGTKKQRRRALENIKYEVDGIVSFDKWLELRDRARKDLFWLGRLLGKDLYRSVHQVICNQFVPKNFGGEWLDENGKPDLSRPAIEPMYFEGYRLVDVHAMIEDHQEWREQEMMLLDSRGFFKSTINGIDSVQWLLNVPDIRIFIIAGKYDLSILFQKEIKSYFYLAHGQEPTAFHLLFPEYILRGADGVSKEPLVCPARKLVHGGKEPSLWVDSIVSGLSGFHCDIKKGDDIVTDKNSNTLETREELKMKYDGTDDLLDPHGFQDHIGTRYFTKDWYGMRLEGYETDDENNMVVVDGKLIPKPSDEEVVAPLRYFCRGCWTVKPEFKYVPLVQLEEHMVDLTFPQRWTFRRLKNLLFKKMAGTGSDRGFRNQQLNIATDEAEVDDFTRFDEKDIRSHMYQRDAAPKNGDLFIVWDWALSERKTSDYSVGVVARRYKNDDNEWALVVLEILYGKWKYDELAIQIVSLARKWNPQSTTIEASNAYELLKDHVDRVAFKIGFKPYIHYKPVSNQENAKRNRIKSLQILLTDHRLHFVTGPWTDEMVKQFVDYTGEKKNRGRKDDIPDACSFLIDLLPKEARPLISQLNADEERKIEDERLKQWMKQHHYDRTFNTPGTRLDPRPSSQDGQMKLSEWYRSMHNQGGNQPTPPEPAAPAKPKDPRMIIFGNKGPWRL